MQIAKALAAVKGTGGVTGSWPSISNWPPNNARPEGLGGDAHPQELALVVHHLDWGGDPSQEGVPYVLVKINN